MDKEKKVASTIGLFSTLIMLFPIYWMFITSLKTMSEVYQSPPTFLPISPTFEAYYTNFIEDTSIYVYFQNSIIIASGSMVLCLILATPAAYAFARKNIVGKNIIILVLLMVQMFPTIILVTPLYLIFSNIGLTNSYLGVILATTTLSVPFAILVLRPFFLGLPKDLEEAAYIDGCNKLTTFFKIILPLSRPGMITVGAISFLFAWGELLYPLTLTSLDSMRPITVGIYRFVGQYQTDWGSLMAVAFMASIPVIIVFIFLQKYIVSGLTAGAVKN